ncbi:hypothetical protein BDQ17DRAFT_154596 [Cyathus striatus]|nr:hypothetical protein BDQ17DRAFT_154596 [Cyathus striatus]
MSECAEVWLRHLVIDGNKEPGLGNKNLSQQLYDNKVDRLRSILAVNGDSNLWSIKVRSCLQERLHQDLNDTENRISQYVATKLCGLGEASLVPTLTLLATGEKIMKGDILPSLKDIITNYDDFTLEPGTLQIILNELDNILSSTELWYTIPEFKDPWIEITCLISKTIDFPNGIRKVVDIIINTPEDWSRSVTRNS